MENDSWPPWLRAQFDKVLLLVMWAAAGVAVIHFIHHGDNSGASWARESASGILGALLLRITGKASSEASSVTTATTKGNPPTTTVTTEAK